MLHRGFAAISLPLAAALAISAAVSIPAMAAHTVPGGAPLTDGLVKGVSAAPGSSQAWAVGDANGFLLCAGGFVFRYKSGAWSSFPGGLAADDSLSGVAAISATHVWVAGGVYPKTSCTTRSKPLLAYSSGGTFHAYDLTSLNLGDAVLNGISASSSTNAWAVGQRQVSSAKCMGPPFRQWLGTGGPGLAVACS